MPTFATPDPISATIGVVSGTVQLIATDRADTIVTVDPKDPSHAPDEQAAEQTDVQFAGGALIVRSAKPRRSLLAKPGSVNITVELPSGSAVVGSGSLVSFIGTGTLGTCRFRLHVGDVRLDEVGTAKVDTGMGTIDIARVTGDIDARNRSGPIQLGAIVGAAVLKNADGDCRVEHAHRNLQIKTASGVIVVNRCDGDLTAKTAKGDVRVGEIFHGSTSLGTAVGQIDIGIREGSAAYLDAHTAFGSVRNSLTSVAGPQPSEHKAQVRARTSLGDILVHRA